MQVCEALLTSGVGIGGGVDKHILLANTVTERFNLLDRTADRFAHEFSLLTLWLGSKVFPKRGEGRDITRICTRRGVENPRRARLCWVF